MRNIKLTIEYDGSNFCGWQYQPNSRSVQQEVEKALQKFLQQEIRIVGAGRTDSGVHALGQIACFRTEKSYATEIIEKALNRFLSPDIRILQVEEVPLAFNPRFDAVKRSYRYQIAKKRHAINRWYACYCKYPLNLEKIRSASHVLIGEHDFRSFCKGNSDANHYRCTVESIIWSEMADLIRMEIVANRFLHNMVRIIVGTMIDVGRGLLTENDVRRILEKKNRTMAGRTAPAKGLFLVEVIYPKQSYIKNFGGTKI